MSQVKYHIYTYQLSPTATLQYDLFEGGMTKEKIMEKKNVFFFHLFDADIPFFHRKRRLNYLIGYKDDDFILMKLANKKKVSIEQSFQREKFESEPSTTIAIFNNPEKQYIVIESDLTSFGNSKVVKTILQKTFEKELEKFNLKIKINPNYEVSEFWDIINKYNAQVDKIVFEFVYPNLPRVNKTLPKELKEASRLLRSTNTNVTFAADKNDILDELNAENEILNGMAEASAEGAGLIKVKGKGFRAYDKTGEKIKSIEFDSFDFTLPKEYMEDIVKEFKGFFE